MLKTGQISMEEKAMSGLILNKSEDEGREVTCYRPEIVVSSARKPVISGEIAGHMKTVRKKIQTGRQEI